MATAAPAAQASCLQLNKRRGSGTPGKIRTCDLWFRRPTLYPTELRALRVITGEASSSFFRRPHLVTYLPRPDQIAACGSDARRGISKTARLPPTGATAESANGTPRYPPPDRLRAEPCLRLPSRGSDNTPEERGEAYSSPYSSLFPLGRPPCLKNSRWPGFRWTPP